MARPMRMKDKKNYRFRIHAPTNGTASGSEMSEESKYLSIKFDLTHSGFISEANKRFMKEYEEAKKKQEMEKAINNL